MAQDFDPLQPETFDSALEEFARLRQECPVAHTDAWGGFWALTRYADVRAAAGDPKTFITSVQNVVPRVAFTGRRPPLHLDPPEHTPYRRALNPLLSEERVAAQEPVIRRLAIALLDPLVARGDCDICADFGSYLPVQVFGEWMNLPRAWLTELHDAGRAFNIAVQSAVDDTMKETSLVLYDLARRLIALRKAQPADPATDPTTALLAARDNGEPLPDEMIVGCVRQVLVVGMIAPMVLIGSITTHLCRDPALQQRLRAEPELIPEAIEEFLRLYTPYRGFARTAKRDVELHGRHIRPGEPIALVYASANRDAAVFPEPDEFRLARPNIRQHLAFGRGPHLCAGIALARQELRIALEELLKQTRHFEVCGELKMSGMPEIGPIRVPLRLISP